MSLSDWISGAVVAVLGGYVVVRWFWPERQKPPSTHDAEMTRLAAEGDGYALYRLGESDRRRGRKRRAIRYYRQSAEAGCVEAASTLGHILSSREAKEREGWLQRAAQLAVEQELPAIEVARHLRNAGRRDQADTLLREAAESGDANAAFQLGLEHARWGGDPIRAERYLRLAADAGHCDAQTKLGRMLMDSDRRKEGVHYFRLAIDQGGYAGLDAARELGRYEWKSGPHQDADQYLRKAASPDAPRVNALTYAEFLYERGRPAQAAELMRTRYGRDATTFELGQAAEMLRRIGRPADAAVYEARVEEIKRMDAVDVPID